LANLLPTLAAQMLGAIVGAALVWLHYFPHWKETPDAAAKLACFCTAPAIRNVVANLLSEIIATFLLVFVIGAIFSKSVSAAGPAAGLGPYLAGSLVWGIGLSLGGSTGYAINPARDLGPRIAHAILPIAGKGGLRLELCADSRDRTAHRWLAGRRAIALACDFLIRAESKDTLLASSDDSGPSGEPARTWKLQQERNHKENEFDAIPVAGCVAESVASRPRQHITPLCAALCPGLCPAKLWTTHLALAEALRGKKIGTVFTHLGENIKDRSEAQLVKEHYLEVLERIRERGLQAEISVKTGRNSVWTSRQIFASNI